MWREANQPADLLASMESETHEEIIMPCNFPINLNAAISNDANGCNYNRL